MAKKGKVVDEERWKRSGVTFSRHFAASTRKLREKALSRPDYDPATLFKWGQMMALAVVRMMQATERRFGAEGQQALTEVLVHLGREIGREVLRDWEIAPGTKEIQVISAFTTYMNEEIWASPEIPKILDENTCTCDILWCPHQDHYTAFDCRVQRYIVQGLMEAFQEKTGIASDGKFTHIMPKGAKSCHFEMRRIHGEAHRDWTEYSSELARRALDRTSQGSPQP